MMRGGSPFLVTEPEKTDARANGTARQLKYILLPTTTEFLGHQLTIVVKKPNFTSEC